MQANTGLPLNKVRVLEVGTYVAAPALGLMLALLGAEVIKVEPPGGDLTRTLTPWSWVNYNFLKKSIVIDLKKKHGVGVFKRLVKSSDIIVEALSPGTSTRLGIGFEQIKELNEGLIYCSLKGFSSQSSYSKRPAFDTIAQAEGGLMRVTMTEKSNVPGRVGNPSVDLTAATFALVNILACLILRQRLKTPAYIEVPLYDVVVFWNSYWFPYIEEVKKEPEFLGSTHPGYSPYGVFKCIDGYVFIGVISDSQWNSLAEKLEIKSPGLERMKDRITYRKRVNLILQRKLKGFTKKKLIKLIANEVPCAEVNSLDEVMNNSRFLSLPNSMKSVRFGGKASHIFLPPLYQIPVRDIHSELTLPEVGEHTKSLLLQAGYTSKEIRKMVTNGVVS